MESRDIRAIIGLGNPGDRFTYNRHNIGFRVLDALAAECGIDWQSKDPMLYATLAINGKKIYLIKPQTFMNTSGKVIPFLAKQGIQAEQIIVVHDELEKPFGHVSVTQGGSARGHNGLRSIIEACGKDFIRVRCGIGRPAHKDDVGHYVLSDFTEPIADVERLITSALEIIKNQIN